MEKKTFKISIILVVLLFVNIEAAHAGLIQKLKVFIHSEFTDVQLFFILFGTFIFSILTYVIATPISIGKEKVIWPTSLAFNNRTFDQRRRFVKKTEAILSKNN